MKKIGWIVFYLMITACVDPIKFNAPSVAFQMVVDGTITNEPGPYRVSLSRVRALDADLSTRVPVYGAKVVILSDAGESEVLTETAEYGVFVTKSIQGKVGRSYSIRITTSEGAIYESDPEKMAAVGPVQAVRFEFEAYTVTSSAGIEVPAGRFNISSDGSVASNKDNYIRWRLVGTYEIITFPEMITSATPSGALIPNPAACSGVVFRSGQGLLTIGPCTCCLCWVNEFAVPVVSDDQFLSGGVFKNVRVGSVTVTPRTFYDKYYAEVQQMALTKQAFDYWKLVKAQKDGAASLFQPPLAKLKGNIHNVADASEEVQGYFEAASISRKGIFINRQDVPYRIHFIDTLKVSCLYGPNTTNVKPAFWQ